MNEYYITATLFKGNKKPELVLGIESTIRFKLVDSYCSPIQLNSADTLTLAVDTNFDHADSLMVFTDDLTVVEPDKGIVEAVIRCDSTEFIAKLNKQEKITVWMELARYAAGSANPEILLRDQCTAYNRVQFTEGEPSPSDPSYYTAAQIDSMLAYYRAITLAACSGLGEYLSDNSFTMTWVDPDNVMLNGASLADWNQTVLVRKVGSYPADHTDGTVLATTSRTLGNKNAYRSSGFTDSDRESGTTYYYKLFSQTTAGVWNNLTGNQFAESTNMSWGMVQAFVRAGRGPDLFPVGTVFEVEHPEYTVDGHGIYFRVAGHDQVPAADESLTHTMCLEMVDILFSAAYDENEMMYALTADTIAQTGKSYYTYDGSSFTLLIDGTDYDVGDSVPIASWYEKNIDGRNNGSNNAAQSNMIQWANSTGAANQWFVPQTLWDQCSSTLAEKSGFMRYLDPLFAAVVQPAELITALYKDEDGGSISHSAKFWALSATQVFGTINNGVYENSRLSYYANGGSPIKHPINSVTDTVWYMRSPTVLSGPHIVTVVQTSGTSGTRVAHDILGYSLACIIA